MPSTFSIAMLLIFLVIFGSLQGALPSVYATGPFLFPSKISTPYKVIQYDKEKNCAVDQHTPTDFKTYLTHFACGHVTVFNNGTTLRKFTLIADDFHGTGKPIVISTDTYGLGKPLTSSNQTYKPVIFHAWTFNGTVPGPTMRFTQGDHVQIKVINAKDSQFPHSLHMHSMHPGPIDGMSGLAGMIEPGTSFTYDFIAQPTGAYPYHCHMFPVQEHISRGLYGMMIIDPPTPRPQATEMVMMLNSYTYSFQGVNGSGHLPPTLPASMQEIQQNLTDVIEKSDENNGPDNQFYSVNGMPFGYVGKDSVHLTAGTPYRIYLANMVEFDPVNSFHMHGNMFYYTPSGTPDSAKMYTDIVTLGQGDRGMLEFKYNYPGQFMFHSHINHFSDLRWTGFFNVTANNNNTASDANASTSTTMATTPLHIISMRLEPSAMKANSTTNINKTSLSSLQQTSVNKQPSTELSQQQQYAPQYQQYQHQPSYYSQGGQQLPTLIIVTRLNGVGQSATMALLENGFTTADGSVAYIFHDITESTVGVSLKLQPGMFSVWQQPQQQPSSVTYSGDCTTNAMQSPNTGTTTTYGYGTINPGETKTCIVTFTP